MRSRRWGMRIRFRSTAGGERGMKRGCRWSSSIASAGVGSIWTTISDTTLVRRFKPRISRCCIAYGRFANGQKSTPSPTSVGAAPRGLGGRSPGTKRLFDSLIPHIAATSWKRLTNYLTDDGCSSEPMTTILQYRGALPAEIMELRSGKYRLARGEETF